MKLIEDVYKYTKHILLENTFECDRNKKAGFRFFHSILVANLSLYILENCLEDDIPEKYKEEMMIKYDYICVAALLHDIKKDKYHHADVAADTLKDILKDIALYTESSKVLEIKPKDILIIENMIRKHGSHGSDDEKYKYYIRLIQDAYNISRYISYFPEEVFYNVFDIRDEKERYLVSKKKVKEKHKDLNYMFSKEMLRII